MMPKCSECGGEGKLTLFTSVETCKQCNGTGYEPQEVAVVPQPGTPSGEVVKYDVTVFTEVVPQLTPISPALRCYEYDIKKRYAYANPGNETRGQIPYKLVDDRGGRVAHLVIEIGEGIVLDVSDELLTLHRNIGRAAYERYCQVLAEQNVRGKKIGLNLALSRCRLARERISDERVKQTMDLVIDVLEGDLKHV